MQSILLIINSLTTGGAERQVINDANLLNGKGFDITIAYYGDGTLRKLLEENIKVYSLKSSNVLLASLNLFKLLIAQKYDFVFGHMYWALKVAAIPCFLTRHKFVFFEHGLGLWRKFYHIAIVKTLQSFAKKIVVVSNKKKSVKIEREKTNKKKIIIIPNSFQLNEFNDFNQFAEKSEVVKIIFVGRFNPVKQLSFLPEIAKKILDNEIRNFQFILCGSGVEEKKIKAEIAKYELSEYFLLTGYVDNPFQYLLQSDINILPSRIEDLSVALLEAGYAGLPMVVFDVGGNADIVKNNKTGYLVKPFDLDEFAIRLQELIEQPALRKRLGIQAHGFIESNFTEEHRYTRLLEMMNSI